VTFIFFGASLRRIVPETVAPLLRLLVAWCDISDHPVGYPTLQQTRGMQRDVLGVDPFD
jgi:hypothetical protein